MVLIIDNYDSFTYNLVQYLGELGVRQTIVRNDERTVEQLLAGKPEAIVISPGPCTPRQAGISVELIQNSAGLVPLLGVCLGHQAIGEAFGGKVVKAQQIYHGKTSEIYHSGTDLFRNIHSPFTATRYHSLIVDKASLPNCLHETAWTNDGTIMGLRHKDYPIWGVQFHPESFATEHGKVLLKNFLDLC